MSDDRAVATYDLRIEAGPVELEGTLAVPERAEGLVIFAHGSGSSRFSPRNRFVAERLGDAGLATLLIDLLTPDEERIDALTRAVRFDIPRLAERLVALVDWAGQDARTKHLAVGLFGASTGAGAALIAAAQRTEAVEAVVSRGGRPDLAGPHLSRVRAPTLLLVGGRDAAVIELNREAQREMTCSCRLEIVEGATHLFEEPGTLESVADAARDWFREHLRTAAGVS